MSTTLAPAFPSCWYAAMANLSRTREAILLGYVCDVLDDEEFLRQYFQLVCCTFAELLYTIYQYRLTPPPTQSATKHVQNKSPNETITGNTFLANGDHNSVAHSCRKQIMTYLRIEWNLRVMACTCRRFNHFHKLCDVTSVNVVAVWDERQNHGGHVLDLASGRGRRRDACAEV